MESPISEKQFIGAYDTYSEAIFRFCYFRTKDRELAKDLMQQCFLKTWMYVQEGNHVENMRAFLYKIAGNLLIDWYRKRKEESLDTLQEEGFEPVDTTMQTDQHAEIGLAMKTLDQLLPQDRELIVWKYVDGLSSREIAKILDKSPGTVSVAIHRAIHRLKEILKKT